LTSVVESSREIKVFPNPAEDLLNLFYSFENSCEIRIMSADGRLIMLTESGVSNQVQIDVSSLEPGMYLIEVMKEKPLRAVFLKK